MKGSVSKKIKWKLFVDVYIRAVSMYVVGEKYAGGRILRADKNC